MKKLIDRFDEYWFNNILRNCEDYKFCHPPEYLKNVFSPTMRLHNKKKNKFFLNRVKDRHIGEHEINDEHGSSTSFQLMIDFITQTRHSKSFIIHITATVDSLPFTDAQEVVRILESSFLNHVGSLYSYYLVIYVFCPSQFRKDVTYQKQFNYVYQCNFLGPEYIGPEFRDRVKYPQRVIKLTGDIAEVEAFDRAHKSIIGALFWKMMELLYWKVFPGRPHNQDGFNSPWFYRNAREIS